MRNKRSSLEWLGFLWSIPAALSLASGALTVLRDGALYMIGGQSPFESHNLFWTSVRICFVLSSIAAWLIEHWKVRRLENPSELSDSLRRRITALADDISMFWMSAQSSEPGVSDVRYKNLEEYYNEKRVEACVRFNGRVKGLMQELDSKGVNTHIVNGKFAHSLSDLPGHLTDVHIQILRDFAYKVDHNGIRIQF